MADNQVFRLLRQGNLALWFALLFGASGWAQDTGISMEHHGWGRFAPGAWQHTRIVTKSFDKNGKLVSTTTSAEHVTLITVHRGHATLRIESMLEVGGKTFEAPVRTVAQGYHGEEIGSSTVVTDLGEDEANVEGKPINCHVRQYETDVNGQRKVVTVHYSPEVAPYILQRETTTTASNSNKPANHTNVEVVALDRPYKVLNETKPTAHLKTVKQNGSSATTTMAIHATDVPGEVVGYSSEERDSEGKLIRLSTMELVDYGYSTPDDGRQVQRRRDWRKYKRRRRRGK